MSTDLEYMISDSLRARGDGEVNMTALRSGTMTRARSIRRRRVLVGTAGLAVVVAAGALAVPPLLADTPSGTRIGPAPAAPPPVAGQPARLPTADAPPAAVRPDLVGTDPGVLHFDLDPAAFGGAGRSWGTAAGLESLAVTTGRVGSDDYHPIAIFHLARTLDTVFTAVNGMDHPNNPPQFDRSRGEPISVKGRPGSIMLVPSGSNSDKPDGTPLTWFLWWQPVDGLWVGLLTSAPDKETVLTRTRALKLDRSQRCVLPAGFAAIPAGARWTECGTLLEPATPARRSWQGGDLTLTHDRGGRMSVVLGDVEMEQAFVPNRIVGGRPAMWHQEAPGTSSLLVPISASMTLYVYVEGTGFTEADVLLVADGFTLSPDLNRPETWPVRPIP